MLRTKKAYEKQNTGAYLAEKRRKREHDRGASGIGKVVEPKDGG